MERQILENYNLGGDVSIKKIPTGLIHQTYLVEIGGERFILQKQHEIFSAAVVEDVNAVSQHLLQKGLVAQTVVKTKNGALFVEEGGGVWRLLTYIPGEVYETVTSAELAYEAGKALGRFHGALLDFAYEFKHARPMHHNTKEHLRLLTVAVARDSQDSSLIRANSGMVAAWVGLIQGALPKLLLPEDLRKIITHGDPKITNIIFGSPSTSSGFKALAMIDVDDVGRQHSPLIELGDAFRSWCGKTEDDPQNNFNLEYFEAGIRGYFDGSNQLLTTEEVALVPQAIQLITLELASRFLRDYFEDNYFGWDATRYESRRAHNLARAQGQVALYRDLVAKDSEIKDIIQKTIHKV